VAILGVGGYIEGTWLYWWYVAILRLRGYIGVRGYIGGTWLYWGYVSILRVCCDIEGTWLY